ncbi:MAG: rod shape-determining protein RodA [Planctomycetes bacterium]|nr:rod shape-determining protein RodA [Planctomycetota bacterium]
MKLRRLNWVLLGSALLLSAMGMLSLGTMASPTSFSSLLAQPHFAKQALFLGLSLAMMAGLLWPHYMETRRAAYVIYALSLLALVGVLLLGRSTRGARAWISLGPVNFQPAEFMKIAAVLAIARVLSLSRDPRAFKAVAVSLLLAAVPMGLILVQPDLGNAMLFYPVLLAMLFVAGVRKRWLLTMVLVAVAAVPSAYLYGMKDYQRYRLTSFLWPDRVEKKYTYQQTQSIRAVAAGGLAGRGFQESRSAQPLYVPDRHTDFVFSIIAEEWGFAGATLTLLLFGLFFVQAWRIAHRTQEPYGRLVVTGLTTFFAFQAFINIGMTVRLAPITGLTLPFVSYGGSSLVMCFLSLAILLNIDMRWVPTFAFRDMDRNHVLIREFLPQRVNWLRS